MTKVLLIGYGSIGKRHEEVLLSIPTVENVDLVTKQDVCDKKTYKLIEQAPLDEYDYFVIASETSKHYEQLVYLDKNTQNKLILCEKPLFHRNINYEFINNKIYVGYVLRYHPIIQKLKEVLNQNNEKVIYANICAGQYLPSWRPNQDYRKSYSASKAMGGGVLKDLSHEIDYAQFLFGELVDTSIKKHKVSNLDIDSDDFSSVSAKSKKGAKVIITLDYLSRIPIRQIIAHSNMSSYYADLSNLILQVKSNNEPLETIEFESFHRNYLYKKMHYDLLSGKCVSPCTLIEALSVNVIVNV